MGMLLTTINMEKMLKSNDGPSEEAKKYTKESKLSVILISLLSGVHNLDGYYANTFVL